MVKPRHFFGIQHSTLTRNSSLGSKATLNTGASCPSNFLVSPEEMSTSFIVKSLEQTISTLCILNCKMHSF